MANRKLLVGLLILCLSVYFTECKGGRSSGRSSSRGSSSSSGGGSSWGKGWGGSSSSSGSSWSKPISSSSSLGSSYKPSSSWNTGSSSSSWSKPSSGSSSHSYPSSPGLSGSGSGSHSYPSSGSGLSGSGSRYPSSNTGSHSYPSSGSGLSGSGSRYPSSNTGSHGYPSSGTHYYPPSHVYHHTVPHTYYTAPQHVYITQYQNSDSRYSNLLTGLTLYNMGRSHSHYHDHYYYDDYYRHRYHSTGSSDQPSSYSRPNDEATCTLRIKENGKLEVLKIPCEIVSTFTEGGKKIESDTTVTHRVCTSTITTTNIVPTSTSTATPELPSIIASTENTTAANITRHEFNITSVPSTNLTVSNASTVNITAANLTIHDLNKTEEVTTSPVADRSRYDIPSFDDDETRQLEENIRKSLEDLKRMLDSMDKLSTTTEPTTEPSTTTSSLSEYETELKRMGAAATARTGPITIRNTTTDGDTTIETVKTLTATQTVVNVTTCTLNFTDPLKVQGPAVNPSNMECSVDIKTKEAHFRNTVECSTLMEYSKMPVPQKESKPMLPSRDKLKSWIEKPPWWMAMMIAV